MLFDEIQMDECWQHSPQNSAVSKGDSDIKDVFSFEVR